MTAEIIPEIIQELNELAADYAGFFEDRVKAVLKNKKFYLSGSLHSSVRSRVIPATADKAPVIEIIYDEHGEFIGKRKLLYTKLAPPKAMLEFVQSSKFRIRSVPGYRQGVTPGISRKLQEKRVAYAMAVSRKRKEKNRVRRWKKLALPELLREMNENLARVWAEKIAEILAKELSTN